MWCILRESSQNAALYRVLVSSFFVFLHFRTLGSVLLAFLPVLLGSCWTLGVMGFFGVPFNPVNIMSLTLIIGIGVTSGTTSREQWTAQPAARRPDLVIDNVGELLEQGWLG